MKRSGITRFIWFLTSVLTVLSTSQPPTKRRFSPMTTRKLRIQLKNERPSDQGGRTEWFCGMILNGQEIPMPMFMYKQTT